MNLNFSQSGSRAGVIEALQAAVPKVVAGEDAASAQEFKDEAIRRVNAVDAKFDGIKLTIAVSTAPAVQIEQINVSGYALALSQAEKAAAK